VAPSKALPKASPKAQEAAVRQPKCPGALRRRRYCPGYPIDRKGVLASTLNHREPEATQREKLRHLLAR
jgi:hypothetical protein